MSALGIGSAVIGLLAVAAIYLQPVTSTLQAVLQVLGG